MTTSPLVSFVIPTYDRADLLRETLDSIRAQSHTRWEAIIVDDRSTDGTLGVLESMAGEDERIRPSTRESSRRGAPVCRNEGLARAQGELVVFMDSDDLLMDRALEARIAFLTRHPEYDATVSITRLFERTPRDSRALYNVRTDRDDLDRFLVFDIPWCPHAATWRRAALERVAPWDETLPSWQDWDFHVRALAAGLRVGWNHQGADCYYRVSGHSTIGDVSERSSHLPHHESLVLRTRDHLRDRGLLTSDRRRLFHGIAYWLSERWALEGDRPHARRLWRSCRDLFEIPASTYATGRTLLELTHTPLAWKAARRIAYQRWPSDMFPWQSATYRS